MTMTDSEARSATVEALVEEFLERYRNGERPPLKEYIDRHPELAGEIREVFPALAMMEKIVIVEDSLADNGDRREAAPALERLGDYRIIREVGRGGMGVVYEAEQVSLGRHVALKVLPNKALFNARHKLRFEREAKSAGKLHHTNIVPVFGVGEQDGLPYYVMQFIQGLGMNDVLVELIRQQSKSATPSHREPSGEASAADLARSLLTGALPAGERNEKNDDAAPKDRSTSDSSVTSNSSVVLPGQSAAHASKKQNYWQSIATVGAQVASALDYAHSQGILHRDIKPSNLLLARRGTVWVTDFGLAKSDDQENLTHTGDILGTLRYMPPEAFEGKADRRGDVYSLGLTLYELLAMRPAFGVKDRNQLIQQVTTTEPPRLEMLNPAIPRDLVTIIHKAIDRDANHRYASAAELEADLRRFLDDEPIQARRISATERLRRWCRRQPAVAAAGAFALLLLAALVALPITLAVTEARNAAALAKEKAKVDAALKDSRRQSAVFALEQALSVCEQGEVARGLLLLARGLQRARAAEAEDLEEAFRWNLGAWSRENHELLHVMKHAAGVNAVAFSPDSKLVATASRDVKVRLWDVATGLPHGVPLAHPEQVNALAFHPDGRLLTGCEDGEARLWDVTTARQVGPKFVHGRSKPNVKWKTDLDRYGVASVAFSPDGRFILTGGKDGIASRWETASGQRLGGPLNHPVDGRTIHAVAYDPQGELILMAGDGGICCLWDPVTDKIVGPTGKGYNGISAVFHPFERKFATIIAWQSVRQCQWQGKFPKDFEWIDALRPPLTFIQANPLKHHRNVRAVAYTPDGALLLTGSKDRTAKFWDAASGRPFGSSLQHQDWVWAVAVSPNNRLVVTGSKDKTARLWRISRGSKWHTLSHPKGEVMGGPALRYDSIDTPAYPGGNVTFGPAFDSTSTTVLTGNTGRAFRWDVVTGKQRGATFTQQRPGSTIGGVVLSPDGKTVYTADMKAQVVRFWDADTGRLIGSTPPHDVPFGGVALSPDGRTLLTGTYRNPNGSSARLWDAQTGRPIGEPLKHQDNVFALAFRPDGKAVLTGSNDRTTRLWDAATGAPLGPPLPHPNGIGAATFRHDGLRVALGSADRTAQVWDPTTWTPIGPVMQHGDEIKCVTYNPKGDLLLTSSKDGTARIWHVATAKRIGPVLEHAAGVGEVTCSPNGRIVGTAGTDRTAGLWAMPVPVTDDPEQVWRWAQRITGLTLGEDGAFHVLSPEEVAELGAAGKGFDHQGPREHTVPRDFVLFKALRGEPVVKDAAELMELARYAAQDKERFAAAADLLRDSFKAHPDWRDAAFIDPPIAPGPNGLVCNNRHYAAAVAAMAAARQEDAESLNVEQRAAWRHQGIEWMHAEVDAWSKRLETATPEEAAAILQFHEPRTWLKELRNAAAYDDRPAAERDAFRQFWAASAHVYAKAFAIDRKLADDMEQPHRYNAALAAALAGSGPSDATDKLQDEDRARLRKQALTWLRADLAHWTKQSQSPASADRGIAQRTLKHWQVDTDLAGLRATGALALLRAEESEEWRKLWADIKELLEKTEKEA
jgi:WD40 repeat protein/serine/threonine protein kinase